MDTALTAALLALVYTFAIFGGISLAGITIVYLDMKALNKINEKLNKK